MSKEIPEIRKLLEMRGESAPADDYFESFLAEFHLRQRQDLMKRSARSLLCERAGVWFRELGRTKWMYGAGAAYALIMVGFFAWPKGSSVKEGVEPVSWEGTEQKVLRFEQVPAGKNEEELPKPTEF